MRGCDRKTICFKHIREHRGQAMLTNWRLVSQSPRRPQSTIGYVSSSRCQTANAKSPTGDREFVHPRSVEPSAPRRRSTAWWSQTGSNRRPHACKARALPTELWPLRRSADVEAGLKLVGLGRLELPTSRLSSARSNQLSYKPNSCPCARPSRMRRPHRAGSSLDGRKRNEDGGCPASTA